MEAGAEPRHLWEEDGGLRGCSTRQNCRAWQLRKTEASVDVTGRRVGREKPDRCRSPRARPQFADGWSRLLKLGHLLFGRPPMSRVRGDVAGWERGSVYQGGGPTATNAAGSGPEGTRHSAEAAILLLQLQPTQNAPSPREPLLHGAEHSGKGISGPLSVGWAAGGRAEPDPRESLPTLEASPRHAQLRLRTGMPADCAGLVQLVLFPAPGSLPLPPVCGSALATC